MKLTRGLVVAAAASVVLAASVSYLVVTENEALGSVHVVHQVVALVVLMMSLFRLRGRRRASQRA